MKFLNHKIFYIQSAKPYLFPLFDPPIATLTPPTATAAAAIAAPEDDV